jgi:regulation of enolase protein 1 (concanavalin A-like superfamily)
MPELVFISPLPTPLRWDVAPASWRLADAALTVAAGPRTDLFVPPAGTAETLNAPRLTAGFEGDFLLSARVAVDFRATFDAGALLLSASDRAWAKLCLEYSPQAEATVVSVVTRGASDDASAFTVDDRRIWLRVARMGQAFAFHASRDGAYWHFVRQFELGPVGPVAAGFLAQSPTGAGCTAVFDEIRYEPERLRDLRNGD